MKTLISRAAFAALVCVIVAACGETSGEGPDAGDETMDASALADASVTVDAHAATDADADGGRECGEPCPPGSTCADGECRCVGGGALCSGSCVDTATDRNNCGDCGNACSDTRDCVDGLCVCAGGACGCTGVVPIRCDGMCLEGATDRNNCGECGRVCGDLAICRGGVCAPRSVVLFGGGYADGTAPGVGYLGDTWEWDGTTWTARSAPISPPSRVHHALAYDAVRHVAVLFGGASYGGGHAFGTSMNDTWTGTEAGWVRRDLSLATTRPRARWGHALAYHAARDRVILFGGAYVDASGTHELGDTWELDGSTWTWTRVMPPTSPPIRRHHALAYDAARGVVLLFGGTGGSLRGDDTWEWDGTTWTRLTPSSSPPPRSRHALAYDAARARVVLFGGSNSSGPLDDTWEWDGATWTEQSPASRPPARSAHALAYDAARGRIVLFGGSNSSGDLDDVWEWDGVNWIEPSSTGRPPARFGHAMAD